MTLNLSAALRSFRPHVGAIWLLLMTATSYVFSLLDPGVHFDGAVLITGPEIGRPELTMHNLAEGGHVLQIPFHAVFALLPKPLIGTKLLAIVAMAMGSLALYEFLKRVFRLSDGASAIIAMFAMLNPSVQLFGDPSTAVYHLTLPCFAMALNLLVHAPEGPYKQNKLRIFLGYLLLLLSCSLSVFNVLGVAVAIILAAHDWRVRRSPWQAIRAGAGWLIVSVLAYVIDKKIFPMDASYQNYYGAKGDLQMFMLKTAALIDDFHGSIWRARENGLSISFLENTALSSPILIFLGAVGLLSFAALKSLHFAPRSRGEIGRICLIGLFVFLATVFPYALIQAETSWTGFITRNFIAFGLGASLVLLSWLLLLPPHRQWIGLLTGVFLSVYFVVRHIEMQLNWTARSAKIEAVREYLLSHPELKSMRFFVVDDFAKGTYQWMASSAEWTRTFRRAYGLQTSLWLDRFDFQRLPGAKEALKMHGVDGPLFGFIPSQNANGGGVITISRGPRFDENYAVVALRWRLAGEKPSDIFTVSFNPQSDLL